MAAMLTVAWEAEDGQRPLTLLAVAGVVLGALLAMLGLPPLDVHGPLHFVGVMDPLCGATRAVRYALRGEWALSWRYNPLGIPLVMGGVVFLVRAAVRFVTHRWVTVQIRWSRWMFLAVGFLVVALEIRQQALAELLMTAG